MLSITPNFSTAVAGFQGKNNTAQANSSLKLNSQPITDTVSFGKKGPTNVLDEANRKLVEKLGGIWSEARYRSLVALSETINNLSTNGIHGWGSWNRSKFGEKFNPSLVVKDTEHPINIDKIAPNTFAIRTSEYSLNGHPVIKHNDGTHRVSIIVSSGSDEARILDEEVRYPRLFEFPKDGRCGFRTNNEIKHTRPYDINNMNETIRGHLTSAVEYYSKIFA